MYRDLELFVAELEIERAGPGTIGLRVDFGDLCAV